MVSLPFAELALVVLQLFALSSPPPMKTAKQLISDPVVGLSELFHSGLVAVCADTVCCAPLLAVFVAGALSLAFAALAIAFAVAGAVGKTIRTCPVSSFLEHATVATSGNAKRAVILITECMRKRTMHDVSAFRRSFMNERLALRCGAQWSITMCNILNRRGNPYFSAFTHVLPARLGVDLTIVEAAIEASRDRGISGAKEALDFLDDLLAEVQE